MRELMPILLGLSMGYSLAEAGVVPYVVAANVGLVVFVITAQLEFIRRKL